MKTIRIKDDIFKTEVLIIFNASVKEANKYLEKIGNKYLIGDDNNVLAQLVRTNNGLYRIIYFKKLNKNKEPLANLVHELFHLVIRICDDKGVPNIARIEENGYCGDETGAYLIEFYYNKIIEKLK